MSEYDLAPTADVPTTRTTKTTKPNPVCDGPCPTCGHPILTGQTRDGQVVSVDLTTHPIYTVLWHDPTKPPQITQMSESRGYLVHRCESRRAAEGAEI